MTKNILVLGASGMLGSALMRRLPQFGYTVSGTVREATDAPGLIGGVDVDNWAGLDRVVQKHHPDAIINCVGVIRQRADGQDPIRCISLNALFPHLLARLCGALAIRVIHISTDCVFSGKKGLTYLENDVSDADDVYGRTKFLGELRGSGQVTLRTSIIGHELRGKLSLLEWFLSQSSPINGYSRAIYSGLPTTELARVIGEFVLPNPALEGLYQVSSEPITKFELLNKINDVYGRQTVIHADSRHSENKTLDSSRFQRLTGWSPPSWDDMISEMHQDGRDIGRHDASGPAPIPDCAGPEI